LKPLALSNKDPKKPEYQMVTKDLVYVNDVSAFLLHIIKERGLNPAEAIVRIGCDGGAGSFKVLVNIFDPSISEPEKQGNLLTGFSPASFRE
jgi:hypothetical protein